MKRSATHTRTHTQTQTRTHRHTHKQTQQHSSTATHRQQHSNTPVQQCTLTTSTLPFTEIKEQHTQTSKTTARQLRTPLHRTPSMLVTKGVPHNGGAALHTRLRPQSAASSAVAPHTHHFHHGITVAVGSYTTAVRNCDCDMQDHRTCRTSA